MSIMRQLPFCVCAQTEALASKLAEFELEESFRDDTGAFF